MITSKTLGTVIITFGLISLFLLFFLKTQVDSESSELCREIHNGENDPNFKTCPLHSGTNSWMIVLLFSVISFIIAIGAYFLISGKLQETKRSFSVDVKNLDDEEKVIINKLKEKQGSIYQSDLIKETQYSKVKITRILDKLESKGILEKKRRGMTNIVVLK